MMLMKILASEYHYEDGNTCIACVKKKIKFNFKLNTYTTPTAILFDDWVYYFL